MDEARSLADEIEERSSLIHREIFQLSALIVVAVAAFLVTRAVAASNREMNLRDAAEWFHRGQLAIQAGDVDEAIASLRRATVRNRDDKRYVLALAQALALKHEEGARSVLMTLREAEPEDRDVNLQLARLAAEKQDVTEALRFYHNALYAPWPFEEAGARRAVRLELVRFLLTHRQAGRAVSELLALSSDMPDEAPLHFDVARLFAGANDDAHALDQFQRVLRLTPDNRGAIGGAGMAAFRLGNYALAQSYLRHVPTDDNDVRTTRELVDLVLSRDPLATRIGSAERRRRLVANVTYVRQRMQACIEAGNGSADSAALENEATIFETQLTHPGILEQDTVEAGVDLIDRLERDIVTRCGPVTALDHALALIGRRHEAEVR